MNRGFMSNPSLFLFIRLNRAPTALPPFGHRAPARGPPLRNAASCLVLSPLSPARRAGGGFTIFHSEELRSRNPCLHSGFHDASTRADTQVLPYEMYLQSLVLFLAPCPAVAGARRAGGGLEIRHSGPRSGIHAFIPDSMAPQRGRTRRSAPTKCSVLSCS
jgi:hypothetical protein